MNSNEQNATRELDFGKLKDSRKIETLEKEIEFTHVYKENQNLHPYEREVICLSKQTELIMLPVREGDWFAGRIKRLFVGIDPERGDVVEPAYFCQFQLLKEQLDDPDTDIKTKEDIRFLTEFWKNEATYFKCRESLPDHVKKVLPSDDYYASEEISYPMYGFGGPILDYCKLLKKGLTGLKEEIDQRILRYSEHGKEKRIFLDCLKGVINIVRDTARKYETEAKYKADKSMDDGIAQKFLQIAGSLHNIQNNAPTSFHEAIQLFWLYNLISLTKNYGRMDVFLGDFLVNDLKNSRINEEEALDMLVGLWEQIVDRGDNFNNRIIIGGKGRLNEENADIFALIALEAQKIVNQALPQLSLRYYEGMNKKLWDKSFEVLATGSTFPIIYNDDINIPAVEKAFCVTKKEAENYVPYGCGEYILEGRSVGSPDAALNVLKALDVTLHNGIDSFSGKPMGLKLGTFESFKTFEDLKYAFARQLEYQVRALADAQAIIYTITGEHVAYPALSLLYDDCIEHAKPILKGGVRYLGGTIETFGNNAAADSLFAIKTVVYDQKIFSSKQLINMLDANFEGFEKEQKLLKSLPKFGNDHSMVDNMAVWIDEILGMAASIQKEFTKLDNFLVVNINNGDSVLHGKKTSASADGRKAGEPLSNGNQPSAGNDTNGLTALLNSMAGIPAECHAGMTHNIKLSRHSLRENSTLTKALLKGYFKNGGTQLMITSVDKKELENAMDQPELYRHIFVRVGGYSERFVDLPLDIQIEVIKRTLY